MSTIMINLHFYCKQIKLNNNKRTYIYTLVQLSKCGSIFFLHQKPYYKTKTLVIVLVDSTANPSNLTGSISPILTMAEAKSELKVEGLRLYSFTMLSVDPPLKRTWSDSRRPFFCIRFLKQLLSSWLGVTKSSGAKFESPWFWTDGQRRWRVLAKLASMSLALLYILSRNVRH